MTGNTVDKKNMTLTDDDLNAIGEAVVDAVFDVIKTEFTKLVWDAIRKIVIGGALLVWLAGQVQFLWK